MKKQILTLGAAVALCLINLNFAEASAHDEKTDLAPRRQARLPQYYPYFVRPIPLLIAEPIYNINDHIHFSPKYRYVYYKKQNNQPNNKPQSDYIGLKFNAIF